MSNKVASIYEQVANYYSSKIKQHGPVPRGVDWNDEASQNLRFEKLLRLLPAGSDFSLNDVGCGYGGLLPYLRKNHPGLRYRGYDISREMIEAADKLHGEKETFTCVNALGDIDSADFSVASGIFNVKMTFQEADWQRYVVDTIEILAAKSTKGFAFNMLTSFSDKPKMRDDLYYGDPCFFFNLCKTKYSRAVLLDHSYPLYEFTVIVGSPY
jgi:SAM-dependent methyltransferase